MGNGLLVSNVHVFVTEWPAQYVSITPIKENSSPS